MLGIGSVVTRLSYTWGWDFACLALSFVNILYILFDYVLRWSITEARE